MSVTGWTPWDFGTNGRMNLRLFLRNSILPRVDKPDPYATLFNSEEVPRKSHRNHLTVRPEAWRRLEVIQRLPEDLQSLSAKWLDAKIPTWPLDALPKQNEQRYRVATSLSYNLPRLCAHLPTNLADMVPWVETVLITTTHTMHLSFPQTRNWAFLSREGNADRDQSLFQYFLWTADAECPSRTFSTFPAAMKGHVVVAYQSPCVLDRGDMQEFVECKSFPPYQVPGHLFPPALTGKHRLWAKIWDTCVREKSEWFILTSYTQWVFGGFSSGMRTAFVSPVFDVDSSKPKIMELMTYWLASAMKLPQAYSLPKVPQVFGLERIIIREPPEMPLPERSESAWEGKDTDAATSARVDLASLCSAATSTKSDFDMQGWAGVSASHIEHWISNCQAKESLDQRFNQKRGQRGPKAYETAYWAHALDVEDDNALGEWVM